MTGFSRKFCKFHSLAKQALYSGFTGFTGSAALQSFTGSAGFVSFAGLEGK
jgi:hypothetical protein